MRRKNISYNGSIFALNERRIIMKIALKCVIACVAIFASVLAGMYWMAHVITRDDTLYNICANITGSNRRIASSRDAEEGEVETIDERNGF